MPSSCPKILRHEKRLPGVRPPSGEPASDAGYAARADLEWRTESLLIESERRALEQWHLVRENERRPGTSHVVRRAGAHRILPP